MELSTFEQFGIALGLGMLVGLQRQWAGPQVAGIRTFALLTLFGALTAQLAADHGGWIIAAGFVSVAALLVLGNVLLLAQRDGDPGLTTEFAALVMYGVGALIVLDRAGLAIVVGGVVAVLLHFKERLHNLVAAFGEKDLRAVFQLVLLALVILPVLPNETFGPYDVLNPFKIWLMVVLICGISVGGFIIYKFVGRRAGILLAGALGGVISSTATTVSYARRTRESNAAAPLATAAILIASTVVFGRVLFEIGVVAPRVLPQMALPLIAMMAILGVLACAVLLRRRGDESPLPLSDDPAELKAAILFGLLYAVVIFAVAAAKEHYGDRGLYFVALLSGLTDMDAITLSTAELIKAERLGVDTGWRMILAASLSNLVFKGLAVALLGSRELAKRIALLFGIAIAGGLAILFLWPST